MYVGAIATIEKRHVVCLMHIRQQRVADTNMANCL